MTTVRTSEEIREQILVLHKQGMTIAAMAERMGVSKTGIEYHRKALGIKRLRPKLTADLQRAIHKMGRQGSTNEEIADALTVHKNTVSNVLRRPSCISDVLFDPVNKFLSILWTAVAVRDWVSSLYTRSGE